VPPPGYGTPPPGTPPPGYGAPPPAYGYPQPGYGNPTYGYGGVPSGPKPDSYLVPAILTTLFCCLPSGIAAIVFAAQVDSKYARGDYEGAVASARNAKVWTWVSVGLGLVAIVLWVVFLVAVGESTNDPYYYD
jgi:hypothetical protein